MRCLSAYIVVLILATGLSCQSGCGADDNRTRTIGDPLVNPEPVPEELFKTADYQTRFESSRTARKRYFLTKRTRPKVALQFYTQYVKWIYKGHELSEEYAKIVVKMDMAGKCNLTDTLTMLTLDLRMVKDNGGSAKHIKNLEDDILFWNELSKDIEADGDDPADFVIEFSIGEGLE